MIKKTALKDLAKIIKKGFGETSSRFGRNEKKTDATVSLLNTTVGFLKLTRHEMKGTAKDADMKEVKGTVNSIYKILDDKTSFIQKMHAEYPILLKRLERLEKQLGIPHTLTQQT